MLASKIVEPVESWFARHRKTRIALYLLGAMAVLGLGSWYAVHQARIYVREVVIPRARNQAEVYFREKVLPAVIQEIQKRVEQRLTEEIGILVPGAAKAPNLDLGVLPSWQPRSNTPSIRFPGSSDQSGRR